MKWGAIMSPVSSRKAREWKRRGRKRRAERRNGTNRDSFVLLWEECDLASLASLLSSIVCVWVCVCVCAGSLYLYVFMAACVRPCQGPHMYKQHINSECHLVWVLLSDHVPNFLLQCCCIIFSVSKKGRFKGPTRVFLSLFSPHHEILESPLSALSTLPYLMHFVSWTWRIFSVYIHVLISR